MTTISSIDNLVFDTESGQLREACPCGKHRIVAADGCWTCDCDVIDRLTEMIGLDFLD